MGLFDLHPAILVLLSLFVILVLILKGFSLWKAGKNNQPIWFVLLFVLNTAGIMPLIYLAFFQRRKSSVKRRR